nr:MAG TPA: hypothetical protein [Caudoviricetes sp.]
MKRCIHIIQGSSELIQFFCRERTILVYSPFHNFTTL